ncbi:PLP-dependent aspartate aminotransferase family protein [Sutterella sp.]|uniref:trans-sulfuration enzyme family protein n=1 Tax=Sutterella sp. TaxID=1981025 RepID=UPI0026E06A8A|nr:PLP-dependent aspartate aminotransferase family protein [Sutterella sp.]MDO5532711.1 PLP-dependent aspartate aminotransferase family protein [Sutterella sp.]
MEYATLAVHGGFEDESHRAVTYPVYLSSTFIQPDSENFQDYAYSRSANPTRASVERLVADLEGAKHAFATSSGMAASALVFELLEQGDRVLISSDVYGGTWLFTTQFFAKRGIEFEVVDDFNTYDFEKAAPNTRLIFIETPTNPILTITDIERVSREAKKRGILTVVDNTFLTSYLQRPLDLGADIVVYSATKYYAGHSDVLAGFVVFNDDALYERLRIFSKALGGVLDPFDSFLVTRGIRTLPLRLDAHNRNALAIAEYLRNHPAVEKVFYPGLADHPGHDIQARQAKGSGGVLSFRFNESEYDLDRFVTSLKLFAFAVSLGGVESLICRPATMTHESYAPELQEHLGITRNLLRLSAGIEAPGDLIADLEQAFRAAKR